MSLRPELRDRILEKARAEPANASHAGSLTAALAVSLFLGACMLTLLGVRPDLFHPPRAHVLGPLATALSSGLALLFFVWARGPHMLGPRVGVLAVLVPVAVVAVGGVAIGAAASVPPTPGYESWTTAARASATCDIGSLALGGMLVLAVVWARRGVFTSAPAWTGALVGACASSLAHAAIHAHCDLVHPAHALVGHALPAIPTVALGALLFARSPR